MKLQRSAVFVAIFFVATISAAQAPPRYLVNPELFAAIAAEFSGAIAKENVRGISQFHRIQASPGYTQAREWVVGQLKEIGITEVEVESFLSDGQTRYQTYVSPLAWTVREAELWVEEPFRERLCRFSEIPVCLSTLSNGGNWQGELVHVGAGTRAADYAGKDVRGKIVLATGYAGVVHREAVIQRGALGVLIYPRADDRAEFPDLVRYNGLWPKAEERDRVTFGFQLSRRQANRLLAALERGQRVLLRAQVEAKIHPGQLEIISAFLRGTDLPAQEIILVAHLDHYKFGANDNASGSAALVEIARTIKTLLEQKKIALRRTIRLMWVPEHLGTIAWLDAHRDIGQQAIAAINLDMVGEDIYKTNSRLRITRTPDSLPSFLNDLVENVAAQLAAANLYDSAGSRNLFHYEVTPYDPGSDHDMFNDGMVGVPAIMLGHWPDWTHHTSEDTLDKVDPTMLKRTGVLATATALWLAMAKPDDWGELADLFYKHQLERFIYDFEQAEAESPEFWKYGLTSLRAYQGIARLLRGLARLEELSESQPSDLLDELLIRGEYYGEFVFDPATVPERVRQSPIPRRLYLGPLGDSSSSTWFREQLGSAYAWWEEQQEEVPRFAVIVYEILNFTDGERTLAEIEDAVRTEFGELPEGLVEHILRDLGKIGLVEFLPASKSEKGAP